MLRNAFRPRWLALLVLVLLAATGMSLLGQWQLDRARQQSAQAQRRAESAAAKRPAVPIESLFRARQSFPGAAAGRSVTLSGRWDGDRQLLVPDREQDGRIGFWLLTPMVLADGSAVPVVRGWVARSDDPAAAPPSAQASASPSAPAGPATSAQVRVTGALHPADPPSERTPGQGSGLPSGQLGSVSVVDLLDLWPYPLYTGYVIEAAQQAPATVPAPVPAQLPPPDPGLAWRNLSYALQWWLFAAFGLFFWYRLVRDDHLGRLAPPPAATTPARGPDADPADPGPAGPSPADRDPGQVPVGGVGEDDRS